MNLAIMLKLLHSLGQLRKHEQWTGASPDKNGLGGFYQPEMLVAYVPMGGILAEEQLAGRLHPAHPHR